MICCPLQIWCAWKVPKTDHMGIKDMLDACWAAIVDPEEGRYELRGDFCRMSIDDTKFWLWKLCLKLGWLTKNNCYPPDSLYMICTGLQYIWPKICWQSGNNILGNPGFSCFRDTLDSEMNHWFSSNTTHGYYHLLHPLHGAVSCGWGYYHLLYPLHGAVSCGWGYFHLLHPLFPAHRKRCVLAWTE